MLVLLAACGASAERAQLRTTLIRRAGRDTIRFSVDAVARRCAGRHGLLLEAAGYTGNGVVVLFLYGDSTAPPSGTYPIKTLGDSTGPRSANVGVRFMIRDVANGFNLDRGTAELLATGSTVSGRVTGEGSESAAPATLSAAYEGVPIAANSVPCRFQP